LARLFPVWDWDLLGKAFKGRFPKLGKGGLLGTGWVGQGSWGFNFSHIFLVIPRKKLSSLLDLFPKNPNFFNFNQGLFPREITPWFWGVFTG